MKRVNWNKYKFHASELPTLMTKSKIKSDPLSATAKTYLRKIWIKEIYGREEVTENKFCSKGLEVEQDSLDIVTRILGKGFLAKNKDFLSNEYICGTPDVVKPFLLDIKSSWSIWTFNDVNEKKAFSTYYWQLFGYMWMLKKKRSKLVYALVNTPLDMIENELYKLSFSIGEEKAREHENNYIFDDIPEKKRVKVYNFKFEKEKIAEVISMCEFAREYLKGIKL